MAWYVILIISHTSIARTDPKTGVVTFDTRSHCQQVGEPMHDIEQARAYARTVAASLKEHPVENTKRTLMLAHTVGDFSIKVDA